MLKKRQIGIPKGSSISKIENKLTMSWLKTTKRQTTEYKTQHGSKTMTRGTLPKTVSTSYIAEG